jgi:beta-lactamase regulating signal transducer with metallopeptidase domain
MRTLLEVGLWNAAAAAVLALAAAALSRLCRRPPLAHVLWVMVLLKLVTPPLVPFALPWPAEGVSGLAATGPVLPAVDAAPVEWPAPDVAPPPAGEEAPVPGAAAAPTPVAAAPSPWSWVGGVWLAGSALWLGWVSVHVARFRRVLRFARRAPGDLQGTAADLARRLGLRRCPAVWLVPGAVSPMVWALGRAPCLLFPAGLLERLDDRGKSALLAHELAHVRRGDHWVRLLELVVTGLYWWHPVVWWARRELHEVEEQCCDAWAVWATGGEGRCYALALLQAVAFVSRSRLPLPAGASGVGQLSHLKRRLAMVLQGKTSRSLSWAGLAAVGLVLLLLPLFPAEGQQPVEPAAVPPQTKDERKELLDTLKRALEKLEKAEAQSRATGAATAAGEGEVAAARARLLDQLKVLEGVATAKRKELEDIEAKVQDVRAKLNAMGYAAPAPRAPTHKPAPALGAPPPADLEKKLDRLQRDLEDLRRELQRHRGQPPGGGNFPAPETKSAGPRPSLESTRAVPVPERAPTPEVPVPPPPAKR